MRTLDKLTIKGFKSIREQTLELGRLNVFIGGNGAGKSNLIGAFTFLREVINQRLARYVATRGGADSILHFGRKKTSELRFVLRFVQGPACTLYGLYVDATDDSDLVVAGEHFFSELTPGASETFTNHPGGYSREAHLRDDSRIYSKQVTQDIDNYRVYHFNDTSDTAAVKGVCDVEDNHALRPQGENLAAYLYYLQERHADHFSLIEDTVRRIAPFFGRFVLKPSRLNESKIRMEWEEAGHDGYFNATALSDGTLRFICLATLLLQPDLPAMVLLDEPELGLHPAAVALLAEMLAAASQRTQVIVATQSVTLINHLTPEQVWTVNREDDQSVFRKLSESDFSTWLEDYSLGELWEKNLLGARP